jgi:hypothetical protein
VGNRCADHVTPLYPSKLALASLTGGGRSVGLDPHGLLRQKLLLLITSLCLNPLRILGVKYPCSGGTTLAVFGVSCLHL